AARLERDGEVGRLGGHMQTGRDAQPFERLLAGKALANERQHGHILGCPGDAVTPARGEREVFDITSNVRSCHNKPPSIDRPVKRLSWVHVSRSTDNLCGKRACPACPACPAAADSTGNCRVPRTYAPPRRDNPAEVTAPVAAWFFRPCAIIRRCSLDL